MTRPYVARKSSSDAERIAVLEARFQAFLDTHDARHSETQQVLKELKTTQEEIQHSLARYTGFWGAILLIGSAIATTLTLFSDFLKKKFGWD